MDTARTLYKISSSSPGSEAAGEAAAALASAAIVFKPVDSNYSSKLLNHAKSVSKLIPNIAFYHYIPIMRLIKLCMVNRSQSLIII